MVCHNPEHQREPEGGPSGHFGIIEIHFFIPIPVIKEELGNLPFSQKLPAEAPDLPKNWQEAYQEDVYSWTNEEQARDWVQGYKDLHFIFRNIQPQDW